MSAKELIQEGATSLKAAIVVSAGTTGSGVGMILDLIPDGIGKLATLVGVVLSIVLIRVHLANYRKIELEMEITARKEAERLEANRKRKEQGLPARRSDDE